ncbi:restriction system protein [Variovorax boronicumulans]|uniref:Restriction system protein n=1 Tax=Variovorax boronicumulans TaxID=436515 RepID=A0AAW8E1N9_9BURK|nr:restriction endonuclease [Variovorax boronicumulans]MDP9880529.1 restriction system protein [Variovorax boronicumulans]MDP9920934.1 restriction system protein [Variovorax boronicumulans]MDP9925815.1 restriction system protein [Variovorax boronicumulans]
MAIFVGILLLVVAPAFLKGPIVGTLGPALRPAGWVALAIGAVLLGLHYVVRRQAAPVEIEPTAVRAPARPAPASTAERREPVLSPSPSTAPHAGQESQWSPAVLHAIEWRRFEALCEALYAQAGFTTRSQSHGADGGVDIWLQSRHSDVPRIVQCKHWQSKAVGVKEMREFFGVMASHQLKSGTYVTSSTFSAEAAAFAKANGIHAQDGAALLRLIGQRTPEQQAALLAVAYEGEYWRPTCASCGIKMVERNSSKNDGSFWGCANYPKCRGRTIPKSKTSATV